jgi:D-tyrosyl-tRNA(Tyr) deacylase
MRALIQRVTRAQVAENSGNNTAAATIGRGLVIFAGFEDADSLVIIEQLTQKLKSLRIFSDETGKLNLSGAEVGAEYLLVSQFTLFADCRYGNRPSFASAAAKSKAKGFYEHFVNTSARLFGSDLVHHSLFGTDVSVDLVNDGPVTLWLDSREIL